jgi:hypothetical protein
MYGGKHFYGLVIEPLLNFKVDKKEARRRNIFGGFIDRAGNGKARCGFGNASLSPQ